jgi:peroxiredoxin
VARRATRPGGFPGFRQIDEAFRSAEKDANQAGDVAGQGEAGVKAYMAKAPKWTEFGPKMWAIVQSDPRHPDSYEALLWIVGHWPRFFDHREERAATLEKAVDRLIRDHLADISAHLAERNVAEAFGMGGTIAGPHLDRLFRALHERAPNRETRGRMGLALARQLKANADLADSFDARGTDPSRRYELSIWPPAFVEQIQKADRGAIRREAEAILKRVKADYGDVRNLYGMVLQEETLAAVADRERIELLALAIGQTAPEIKGEDIDGKPMKLSEFRGKVVLLDFGSHEHCGGCRLVYPRLKTIIEQYKGRPFVIVGVNNNDKREALKEVVARGDITWRCWWDGDKTDGPGPITSRWNVAGYPTFIILDHCGVIRYKDLHPEDARGFGEAVEALIRRAENTNTR